MTCSIRQAFAGLVQVRRMLQVLFYGSGHDLTAPAVRPAMMYFWAMKKTMIVGRIVRVMNARASCQFVPYSSRYTMIPSGQVYLLSEFSMISGRI